MMQGVQSFFFNVVSLLFLALTIIVIVVTIGVATDRMDTPILAPEPTNVPPTPAILPTMTPSPTPEQSPTPLGTPPNAAS